MNKTPGSGKKRAYEPLYGIIIILNKLKLFLDFYAFRKRSRNWKNQTIAPSGVGTIIINCQIK